MGNYKVGIIGCGRMGWLFDEDPLMKKPTSHAGGYSICKKTDIVAVCDINKERLKGISERYKIKSMYTNYKEMLKKEKLEIVSICTPPDTHAEICIETAKSGVKAIFCEKPIATSLKEAEEMIEECKKNNVQLIIDHQRRWDICFKEIKKILENNLIGEVDIVNAFPTVGLVNGGAHLFDLLRYYFGDVEYVSGSILPDESSDPGGRGFVKFKKGPMCFIDSSWRNYSLFVANIYGMDGMLKVGGMIRSSKIIELFVSKKSKEDSGINELKKINYKMPKWAPSISNAIDNIINNIEKKEKILCTGEDGKAALEVALAFHESSKNNCKKIKLPLQNKDLRIVSRETSYTKNGKLKR